jgi:hypothetical protein
VQVAPPVGIAGAGPYAFFQGLTSS